MFQDKQLDAQMEASKDLSTVAVKCVEVSDWMTGGPRVCQLFLLNYMSFL